MTSCDCAKLTAHPIERVDQAPTGTALDAIIERSERVAFERFRWRSVYRCRACGQLWGEHAWSSGPMDVFYLFPIETDDPVRWARESEDALDPPARGRANRKKRRKKRAKYEEAAAPSSELGKPSEPTTLGITEENIPANPDKPHHRPLVRVPIVTPFAQLERPTGMVRHDGAGMNVLGPVRRVIFGPGAERFAFVVGSSHVAVADDTLERVLVVASFDANRQPVRSLGFDTSGGVLAIGTGAAYEVRDVGPVAHGCGWSARRVSDGEVLEAHETEEPVEELSPAFAHGDRAPLDVTEHEADGLVLKWGARSGDILSTWREGHRIGELVVESWAEEPPRIDSGGRRVWTFAHGRTTVFDVASGAVLFHGAEPPAELSPPERDERRGLRVRDRETKVAALGAQITVRATRHALAIYRGADRRPAAWARVHTQVLALSEDERFLVAGGPRRYLVFDLAG